MATKSADILNAVRSVASPSYQAAVPVAAYDMPNYNNIGDAIFSNQTFINEYLSGMIMQICVPAAANLGYENPWRECIKDGGEYGGGVEEFYVEMAKPMAYDPAAAETAFAKRELPPTKVAWHILNSRLFYKRTLQEEDMRAAFCTGEGVAVWAEQVRDSLYIGARFAEHTGIKYMLVYGILSGSMYRQVVGPLSAANSNSALTAIKSIANKFKDFTPTFNEAGVMQYTDTSHLYIFSTADFDATIDVNSLAAAFNLQYAEFLGRRFSCASFEFSAEEVEILTSMFGTAPNFIPITDAANAILAQVQAIAIDSRYLQVYHKLFSAGDFRVYQGLYTNYMLHDWKIYSTSPFQNAVAFIGAQQAATAISLTPATVSVSKGGSVQFSADVTGSGDGIVPFPTYSISGATNSAITKGGLLTVGTGETAKAITITAAIGAVTATSTVNIS